MRKIKTKKSDLEGKKLIFFQLGAILALLMVLYAFEYKSYDKYEVDIYKRDGIEIPSDFVIRTKHKKPPEVKKPAVVIKIDLTNEADDNDIDIDIEDEEDIPVDDWIPMTEEDPQIVDDIPIYIAEKMPEFPGGYSAMMNFIHNNIKYPLLAREANISGIVYIEFIIEKDGSITNVALKRDIGGGCGREAIRVINLMPKWNAGMQNGRPVRVGFTLPIKFSLV